MNRDQNIQLRETVCPHCYLKTRADAERCLFCRKPLTPAAREKTRPSVPAEKVAGGKQKPEALAG